MITPPIDGPVLLQGGQWMDAGTAKRYLPHEMLPKVGLYRTAKGAWVLWGSTSYIRNTMAKLITPAEAVKYLMEWGHDVPADLIAEKKSLEV
jgi:hypothetical protein